MGLLQRQRRLTEGSKPVTEASVSVQAWSARTGCLQGQRDLRPLVVVRQRLELRALEHLVSYTTFHAFGAENASDV